MIGSKKLYMMPGFPCLGENRTSIRSERFELD